MTALEVHGLSKNYPLSDSQWSRFRHAFHPGANPEGLWALRDVTFALQKGEAFGVVGANGSGKSTLLRIVAGILRPTTGSVTINGRMAALLELGSGFSPEFTGRQNLRLNASILGLTQSEIEARETAIVDFASVGEFIDQPIRTWSTGMVLRLAFAVSAHVDPEILIVDEALAVGDIAFRQRCMRRIHDLRARGATILFVSHDTGDVKALCERCLWLDHGVVRASGAADEVIGAYLSASIPKERHPRPAAVHVAPEIVNTISGTHRFGNRRAIVTGATLTTPQGDPIHQWIANSPAVLRLSFHIDAPLESPVAGFLVRNRRGETIFGSNSARENYPLPEMTPGDVHTVDFHWTMPPLAAGTYLISVAISEGTIDRFDVCDYVEDAIEIEAHHEGPPIRGYMRLRCSGVSIHSQ